MSKKKKPSKGTIDTIVKYLWLTFVGGILAFVLFVLAVNVNFLGLFGGLPDFKSLENPETEIASELYSADGVLLGNYYRENRSPVSYNELSHNLINALITTEDVRFENHSGIDPRGMARVLFKSLLMGQSSGGGSTLSQQTAKNLFKTRTPGSQGVLSNIPGLRMLIIKT